MNWYEGSISDAVAYSHQINAIFVVYIVGKEPRQSKTIEDFLQDKKTLERLNGNEFVAVRIEGDSESYTQFSNIYKNVPQPSIYFIGKSGAPIEIATESDGSQDLQRKLQNALDYVIGRRRGTEFIRSLSTSPSMTPTTTTPSFCESSTVVVKSCNSILNLIENNSNVNLEAAKENDSEAAIDEKIIENKTIDSGIQNFERNLDNEIKKRQKGSPIKTEDDCNKEKELKNVREAIKRDRLAKKNERQSILEKFANDRAEQRIQQLTNPSNNNEIESHSNVDDIFLSAQPVGDLNMAKIQFRTPDGNTQTEKFPNNSKFEIVRSHVQNVVLKNSNIKSYTLSGNYPRREFLLTDNPLTLTELGLFPTAVILIIPMPTPITDVIVSNSVSQLNNFSSIFWNLLTPIWGIIHYLSSIFNLKNDQSTTSTPPKSLSKTQKAKTEKICKFSPEINDGASTSDYNPNKDNQTDSFQKPSNASNIHRLRDNNDSDDENNTWNGNSTQQQ